MFLNTIAEGWPAAQSALARSHTRSHPEKFSVSTLWMHCRWRHNAHMFSSRACFFFTFNAISSIIFISHLHGVYTKRYSHLCSVQCVDYLHLYILFLDLVLCMSQVAKSLVLNCSIMSLHYRLIIYMLCFHLM